MANTVIGSTFTIEGEILGEDELLLQGNVKGRIAVKEKLVIEQTSVVEADVAAKSIDIAGQVMGDVEAAERVELKASARLLGDLRTPRLNMADGALISGNIEMSREERVG
ncbi:MAG: polymer-forming cytoskeletal protein [Myxococcales bacterium]|jgi:cytoskeletal protein CcmA (bactofilin family)|nr:polymer-forming cytoskeletal protein [Myxococcales bacterium]